MTIFSTEQIIERSQPPYTTKVLCPCFYGSIFIFSFGPPIIILFIDDGWAKYTAMRGFGGDCWENSKHERVCKDENTCKFGRNFCIPKCI